METLILEKGEAKLLDEKCVNSNWKARFLCKEDEECCQCSFGGCKVKVSIAYNNHPPYTYILTETELFNLKISK